MTLFKASMPGFTPEAFNRILEREAVERLAAATAQAGSGPPEPPPHQAPEPASRSGRPERPSDPRHPPPEPDGPLPVRRTPRPIAW